MARRKTDETLSTVTLDKVIPEYAEHKADMDVLKKICDDENALIKKLMGANGGTYEAGGYKATVTISDVETVDEELMCAKLSAFEEAYHLGIIKVKEYVDSKALEDAIYKKQLPKEALNAINSCRSSKPRATLRVTKIKED